METSRERFCLWLWWFGGSVENISVGKSVVSQTGFKYFDCAGQALNLIFDFQMTYRGYRRRVQGFRVRFLLHCPPLPLHLFAYKMETICPSQTGWATFRFAIQRLINSSRFTCRCNFLFPDPCLPCLQIEQTTSYPCTVVITKG